MNIFKLSAALLSLGAGLASIAGGAAAQTYPSQPVRMVIPFAAGGSPDVIGRIVAEELSTLWGQPVVVENRGGAGGSIAAEHVLGQPADGYTIFLGTTGNMATNKVLYDNLKYDPHVDFVPISLLYASCNVLIVVDESPIASLSDLVDEAKKRPGELTFGTPGVGTAGHLVAELFKTRTETDIEHIPYSGQSHVLNAVLGGHVTMSFEAVGSAVQPILSGSVRGLASTCADRSAQLPDIATFSEVGISDFTLEALALLAARAETAPEIVAALNEAVLTIMAKPEVIEKISRLGVTTRTSSPEEALNLLKEETERWRQVVEAAGIPKLD